MDDIPGGQVVSLRDLGVPGLATHQGYAFSQEFRTCGPVDASVNAATTQQSLIGRIDNGINRQFRNVTLNDFNPSHHIVHFKSPTRPRLRPSAAISGFPSPPGRSYSKFVNLPTINCSTGRTSGIPDRKVESTVARCPGRSWALPPDKV